MGGEKYTETENSLNKVRRQSREKHKQKLFLLKTHLKLSAK